MKVFLKLIFAFLLTLTIQATFAQCGTLNVDINNVTSCSTPNGLVFATIEGNNADYNFEWTDSSGKPVTSSTYFAGNANINFAYKLKVGNYKVVATSTKNKKCILEKKVSVRDSIKDNCSSDLLTLESVTIDIDSKGKFVIGHIGTSGIIVEGTETEVFYSPEGKSAWNVVPKEGVIESYPNLKSYEFVIAIQFGGYLRHMTTPIKAKLVYEGANKLLNETNTLSNSISVSPQPANNYLNLEFDPNIKINSVEILNLGGQVLLEKEISNTTDNAQLNVAELHSGLYLLKINSDKETAIQKIIVER